MRIEQAQMEPEEEEAAAAANVFEQLVERIGHTPGARLAVDQRVIVATDPTFGFEVAHLEELLVRIAFPLSPRGRQMVEEAYAKPTVGPGVGRG